MHLAGAAGIVVIVWNEKKRLLLLFLKIHQLARYKMNILRCAERNLEFTHTDTLTHHMLLGYVITIWHHSQV